MWTCHLYHWLHEGCTFLDLTSFGWVWQFTMVVNISKYGIQIICSHYSFVFLISLSKLCFQASNLRMQTIADSFTRYNKKWSGWTISRDLILCFFFPSPVLFMTEIERLFLYLLFVSVLYSIYLGLFCASFSNFHMFGYCMFPRSLNIYGENVKNTCGFQKALTNLILKSFWFYC